MSRLLRFLLWTYIGHTFGHTHSLGLTNGHYHIAWTMYLDDRNHISVNRPKLCKLSARLYSINWSHNVLGPLGTRQMLIPTDLLARRSTLN